MRWRFFERFQEGVESIASQLVGFIDDVDFVPANRWGEPYVLTQVADLIKDEELRRRIQEVEGYLELERIADEHVEQFFSR